MKPTVAESIAFVRHTLTAESEPDWSDMLDHAKTLADGTAELLAACKLLLEKASWDGASQDDLAWAGVREAAENAVSVAEPDWKPSKK